MVHSVNIMPTVIAVIIFLNSPDIKKSLSTVNVSVENVFTDSYTSRLTWQSAIVYILDTLQF